MSKFSLWNIVDYEDAFGVNSARLRELAEADKEGRVVVLPCKIGDTVYDVDFGRISSHFIRKIEWNKQGGFARCAFLLPFDDFGKTVFLTKEEAEKALEGMKE